MTRIDLSTIKVGDVPKAILWLVETWGPAGDRWTLKNLSYIEFRKDRDASLFLIHWG